MSPIAALRSRRSSDDLPPATTDEELLAWSDALVHEPAPARRRVGPLHAERRIWVDGTRMSTEELLDEIERRAMTAAARKPRLILRRS